MKNKVGAPRKSEPRRRKNLVLPEHIAVMGEKQAERLDKSFNKHVSDLILEKEGIDLVMERDDDRNS